MPLDYQKHFLFFHEHSNSFEDVFCDVLEMTHDSTLNQSDLFHILYESCYLSQQFGAKIFGIYLLLQQIKESPSSVLFKEIDDYLGQLLLNGVSIMKELEKYFNLKESDEKSVYLDNILFNHPGIVYRLLLELIWILDLYHYDLRCFKFSNKYLMLLLNYIDKRFSDIDEDEVDQKYFLLCLIYPISIEESGLEPLFIETMKNYLEQLYLSIEDCDNAESFKKIIRFGQESLENKKTPQRWGQGC